jgi:tetratricopeptide (TPR) repeat protein
MWADARKQIRKLLKLRNAAELHNVLGEVEEKSGNYLTATNKFQRAARMDPSESNIFYWGSELNFHQTLNPAIEVFSEGVNQYPRSPRLAVGLGHALYWSDQYDDAVKALVKATDLSPSDPCPSYFLNKAYQHSHNQADQMIKRFQHFARLRPQDSRAVYYYAMSLWKGKQTTASSLFLIQVESVLKRAVQLDPSFAQAHLELGNLYSQQDRYEEAIPEYQQAIKLDARLVDATIDWVRPMFIWASQSFRKRTSRFKGGCIRSIWPNGTKNSRISATLFIRGGQTAVAPEGNGSDSAG